MVNGKLHHSPTVLYDTPATFEEIWQLAELAAPKTEENLARDTIP